MYRWIILDSLAVIGLTYIVSALWEHIEVLLYGYSQHSVVDAFFGVFFSLVVVACLRLSVFMVDDEGGDDE